MALERISSSLDYISMLPDRPNDPGGLTAAELKAKFDRAGQEIKDYVNDILLPGLEGPDGALSLGIRATPGLTGAENVQQALEKILAQMKGITLGSVADSSVDGEKLSDGAVTSSKLADRAVVHEKLAPASVYAEVIADGGVSGDKLAEASVSGDKLADGAVSWGKIAAGAVNTEALDELAVTGAKIAPGAVSSGKIAPGAVKGAALSLAGAELGGVKAESALESDSTPVRINAQGYLCCPGMSLEKLWENPSPGESFPACTLTLNLSRYALVLISWKRLKTGSSPCCVTVNFPGDSALFQCLNGSAATSGSRDYVLRPYALSRSGLEFSSGTLAYGSKDTVHADDSLAIPLQILGIRAAAADKTAPGA